MAILNDGINGGFTGKVGSVIGYQLNGKWIIKALPKPSKKNKKGTDQQNKCRSKFSLIQSFLSRILDFIRVGFHLEAKSKGMSAHNAAKSYNMLHAFDEQGNIDYTKIRLCQGNLLPVENASVKVSENGLLFQWDTQNGAGYIRADDQVMLMAFDENINLAVRTVSGNRRRSGEHLLKIPQYGMGLRFHTWIAFVADNRESISNSVYLGTIEYQV